MSFHFLFGKIVIISLHCLIVRIKLDDACETHSISLLGVLLPQHELGNKIAL
jgi:hypothetical protein